MLFGSCKCANDVKTFSSFCEIEAIAAGDMARSAGGSILQTSIQDPSTFELGEAFRRKDLLLEVQSWNSICQTPDTLLVFVIKWEYHRMGDARTWTESKSRCRFNENSFIPGLSSCSRIQETRLQSGYVPP